MESSINDDWLSDYMAFVVDPAIFEKNNLIRLGYDAEIIKDLIQAPSADLSVGV